jgi:two-component system LytT family response regulator
MLKALIVDDEINGVESLKTLLQSNCPAIEVMGAETDPAKAIEQIRKLKPDVLFLDIQMPRMSGFELLAQIKDVPCQVIFVTAYDQYAISAFRHNAVDYLLKPVIVSELIEAVNKLVSNAQSTEVVHTDLEKLLLKIRGSQNKKLAVTSMNEIMYIDTERISYLEADSNYTNIVLTNGDRLNSSKTLKEYESLLDPGQFFRVFKTYIINLQQVKKFIKTDGGYILMADGTHITVSRDKRQLVLELLASR